MSQRELLSKTESSVGTLKRGLAILQYFAVNGEATPVTVAKALNSSRSTTYRILEVLREARYLETDQLSGNLRLGMKATELGLAALADVDVVRNAPPYVRSLADVTRETVFLAIMNNDEMVYIYSEESTQPVKMNCKLGSRRPLHSTALGKAYLSALPQEDRTSLIRRLDLVKFTDNTITDPVRLEAEVTLSLARGYAFDDVEAEEGVSCLAAPVRDYSGLPVAAISVSGPTERIVRRYDEIGFQVADTAQTLSRRLGFVTRD